MDGAILLSGLVFSSIGLGYFIYGRKQDNIVFKYSGIGLVVYPYLMSSVTQVVIVGLILLLIPRFVRLD